MAVGVLGRSLGRYLREVEGRHYVQVPSVLKVEAEALVAACNEGRPEIFKALLVVAHPDRGSPASTISADDLLAWRTDDDRVFVLLGRSVEPESSFATATSAFLTDSFPGAAGGRMDASVFAVLGVREALAAAGNASEEAAAAFERCSPWVFHLLSLAVREGGAVAGGWSSQVLEIWSKVLSDLEDACIEAVRTAPLGELDPASAWELVRLCGLPRPSGRAFEANGSLPPPATEVEERVLVDLLRIWLRFVDDFLRPGKVTEVLEALRRASAMAEQRRWWNLPWESAYEAAMRFQESGPSIGRILFGCGGGMRFLRPSDPLADSWHAVTSVDLRDAMDALAGGGAAIAAVDGGGLVPIADAVLLDVRNLDARRSIDSGRSVTEVEDVLLDVGAWTGPLTLDPAGLRDGGTAIVKDPVVKVVPATGVKVQGIDATVESGRLRLRLKLRLTCAFRPRADLRWAVKRKLSVELEVRDMIGRVVQPPRQLRHVMPLLTPSPYWPTAVVLDARSALAAIAPHAATVFRLGDDRVVACEATPDLEIEAQGHARLVVYDARWDEAAAGFVDGCAFTYAGDNVGAVAPSPFAVDASVRLFDEAALRGESPGLDEEDVATVRIAERELLPTNPLTRRDRGGAMGEPSRANRTSPLGRYQTEVAKALSGALSGTGTGGGADAFFATPPSAGPATPKAANDSLYQLVLSTGAGALPSALSFGRLPAVTAQAPGPWVGIGAGPSEALAATPQWRAFVAAAGAVASKVLATDVVDWLSAVDATRAPLRLLRRYLAAHRDLVAAALTPEDAFWSRYPFSVIVLNGSSGPENGTMQAVFMSPLHPARLGWLYSAQMHADALGAESNVLGLIDGWNVPAMGVAPGPGGISVPLVALPLEPGPDGDYASWSALVATTQNGVVASPAFAAGARLPWGGRSGLGERVVEQALRDYASAHPFLTSLVIELRSAVEAPRSTSVDRAVMGWLVGELPEMGGAARVLDSERRQGSPPTRDDLEATSGSLEPGSFSWILRSREDPFPGAVDIAFVENVAPFTQHAPGTGGASTPALPVRRFPRVDAQAGADGRVAHVDYGYLSETDDILGLGGLLAALEPTGTVMRVVTTAGSMHAEAGVRWEVIGDINLEPTQMAQLASSAGVGKQLWEWRPGWVTGARNVPSAGRGAHYVLAKVPQSLIGGLARNMGLTPARAGELVGELGTRGVGIATLRRPATTQEAEAAGLFFASRLLAGFAGCTLPPTWTGSRQALVGLLPIDPLQPVLEGLAGGERAGSRADLLLVVAIVRDGGTAIKLTAVESKHRAQGQPQAGAGPAAAQAAASAELLRTFAESVDFGRTDADLAFLLKASGKLQAFASLIDLAMKFGPLPTPAGRAAALAQDIVDGRFSLEVGAGLAIWTVPAQPSPGTTPGTTRIVEPDGVAEVRCNPIAIESLVWSGAVADERQLHFRSDLDTFLSRCLLPSEDAPLPSEGIRQKLSAALAAADGPAGPGDAADPVTATMTPSQPGGEPSPGTSPVSTAAGPASAIPPTGTPPDGDGPQQGAQELGPRSSPPDPTPQGLAPTGDEQAGGPARGDPSDGVPGGHGDRRPDRGPETVVQVDAFVGAEDSARFVVVGRLAATGKVVALDLDQPKAIGVFGYMGSGKSYLLGALVEGAATTLPGLNRLNSPLAVVVFNYRRNASDRFELSSMAHANDDPADVAALAAQGGAPEALDDLHVLCLPGELAGREAEYAGATASELYFHPASLDVEDWELLMGEPGSDAVFARTIRSGLHEMRRGTGGVTVAGIRSYLADRLPRGSMAAADLRLETVERMVSATRGVDFGDVLRAGRVLTIDLRQPMFNRDDAMKLILVCANQIAKQRVGFNKLVVFDEAHEYMTEAFGERFDGRIRYMRHEGTSYVFATQDVRSVPVEVRRHLGTQFVFSLETRDNIADMTRAAPEFAGLQLQHLEPGTCLVVSSKSTGNLFRHPRLVKVRPRATRHGGKSRILDGGSET